MTELEKVSEATMRFMRGRYVLDEVGNGKDELKFRRAGKTILTIYIREDRFDFLVIFGKAEREKFEAQRKKFPKNIQKIYDDSKTFHDGKWMLIPVADMKTLEAVKELVLIKKKPNRKPFPKEQAVFSRCGMRCDLCVHYTGGTINEELRTELKKRLIRVYAGGVGDGGYWGDDMALCVGGYNKKDCGNGCPGQSQYDCAMGKGLEGCAQCGDFPCGNSGIVTSAIEAKSTSADDITLAILPYVDGQYGN